MQCCCAGFDGSLTHRAEDIEGFGSTNMTLDFAEHGPGFYHLNCSALDWATDTLFSYTVTIPVRAVIPPRFHSDYKDESLEVGERNRRLSCEVQGDPAPNVSWAHGVLQGVRTEGDRKSVV